MRPLCSFISILLATAAAAASSLTGAWEAQTMGADRDFTIQQKGNQVLAHRVMWPEFEGERYKLEHLYRGTLNGNKMSGDLLVKEEGFKDFELLRAFDGAVKGDNLIDVDGFALKRKGGNAPMEAPQPKPKPAPPARPSEPPQLSQAAPPPPPAPPPAPAQDAPPAQEPGESLFANIMGSPGAENMFQVSSRIAIPDEAADRAEEGDALYDAGKYAEALAKYEESSRVGGGQHVELLHRLGRCQLKLGNQAEAKKVLRTAVRLDPQNRELRKDYERASRKNKRRKT